MNAPSDKPAQRSPEAAGSTPIRTRRVSFLLGVVFSIVAVATLQAGLHVLALIRHPNLTVVSDRIDLNRIMQNDPDTFWSLQPNLKNVEFAPQPSNPRHAFHVSTNELGLRNPSIREKGGRLRILAIGDSTTFGQYVEDGETWPAQLQTMLDGDGTRADVVNAGLIGASSFQGLSYLLKRGFDLKPDIVIATYGFNDRGLWSLADRKASPLFARTGLGDMINAVVQRGQMRSPTALPRVSAGEFLDVLMIMAAECEARGVKLYFLVWPNPNQITGEWNNFSPAEYGSLELEAAFRTHARTIDPRHAFHDSVAPVFVDSVHASPAGCRIVAECIAAALRADLPQLQSAAR